MSKNVTPMSSFLLAKAIEKIFLMFEENNKLKYSQALTYLKLQKLMWFCYL